MFSASVLDGVRRLQREWVEQRASPRRKAQLPATVSFGNTEIPCEIQDISEGGVRLKCDAPHVWPERITLSVFGQQRRECEVIWSLNTLLGVKLSHPINILV